MERSQILENIAVWREKIAEASSKWGGAQICAVTKTQDAETINTIPDGGLTLIGENRVQELLGKYEALDPRLTVHLIGSLQLNKVKYITDRVSMIQSVDRIELAAEISKRMLPTGRAMNCLIQVNIAREPQKGGVLMENLPALLDACADLPGIRIKGLMAIMPLAADPEDVRPYFRDMRALFERLRDAHPENIEMETLSMGMSGDAVVAAQEGATMVRLGRALFGERPKAAFNPEPGIPG